MNPHDSYDDYMEDIYRREERLDKQRRFLPQDQQPAVDPEWVLFSRQFWGYDECESTNT